MNRTLLPGLMAAMMITHGGCASLVPSAVTRLAGFDPLSADPAAIAVAVKTSERLRLRTGDVTLSLTLQSSDETLALNENFDLEVVAGDVGDLPGAARRADEHVQLARVAAVDRARLAATLAKARAARGKGKGSLEVAVRGGCRTGAIESEKLRFTAYMRTEGGGEFFPLTRAVSLARMVGADAVAALPPCDSDPR